MVETETEDCWEFVEESTPTPLGDVETQLLVASMG